jgi:hypothetical protein
LDYSSAESGAFVVASGISCPDGSIDQFDLQPLDVVRLSSGRDTLTGSLAAALSWDGFDGNDLLGGNRIYSDQGGDSGVLSGGRGNDTLVGGESAPAFARGGAGDDLFQYSTLALPRMSGGSGRDHVQLTTDSGVPQILRGLLVPDGVEAFSVTGAAVELSIIGNALDNRITVNSAVSVGVVSLFGEGGNDTLASSGSTDFHGGPGRDLADFSSHRAPVRVSLDNVANDGATGEQSNVLADIEDLIGGSGNDFIQGNPFNNNLSGGAGNDTIWAGAGNDTITGGAGRDLMFGQAGDDTFFARDSRTDTIDGGAGRDRAQVDKVAAVRDSVLSIELFI